MAEEDEIDVLGDFNLDILSKNDTNIFDNTTPLLSQNELLQCDYTVHPQWLLDRPSTNPALWFSSSPELDIGKQFEYATSSSGEPHISTENSITDESGWTEKEKNLLQCGIDIFGKSNVNLSQFIGSRTPAEVRYYLKNFYSDVQLTCTSLGEEEVVFGGCIKEETVIDDETNILNANEIPASIEEVIAAVSSAGPTVTTPQKRPLKKPADRSNDEVLARCSPTKSNYTSKMPYRSLVSPLKHKRGAKFKFKTKLKVGADKHVTLKKAKNTNQVKQEPVNVMNESSVRIVTGNGIGVPVCKGEEVIKIRKESEMEDSDSEIDIEDTAENPIQPPTNNNTPISKHLPEPEQPKVPENIATTKVASKKLPILEDLDEQTVKALTTMEEPICEVVIGAGTITEMERFLFHEFFEDRPTKTPMRYLRIRNHILNTWNTLRPSYVTKTSIRHGLRQCGDVNCIGRIHTYLEQIGAINFGCEQTVYSRPLYDLVTIPTTKDKKNPPNIGVITEKPDILPRQRNKKKYINDGEGGCTLTHDERGDIINTTVINEEPTMKQRTYVKKPSVRLIYCRPFTGDKKQEYSIQLDLPTLILMDLHAHMYLTEVMGLIGGHWDPIAKILQIIRYVPCKNIASSTTHCDMCPISQARAADILHSEHLDILGWYHSHPTFAPEPSQQDLDTQLAVQQWIGSNKPCIGFILSPFSLHGALIASPYRCLIVDRKENFEDQFVPYKFKVDLTALHLDVGKLLCDAEKVVSDNLDVPEKSRVNFAKIYFQDNSITYLDKYIYSVKMHLAKCSNINKMTCDAIIRGLSDVCSQR